MRNQGQTLQNKVDSIVKAIEKKVGCIITVHCESKGYAAKLFKDSSWVVLPFDFVNDAAGLGNFNYSLI